MKIQKLTNPLNMKTFATLSTETTTIIVIIPAKIIIFLKHIFLAIILFLIAYEIMENQVFAKYFLMELGSFSLCLQSSTRGRQLP